MVTSISPLNAETLGEEMGLDFPKEGLLSTYCVPGYVLGTGDNSPEQTAPKLYDCETKGAQETT